ncbi:MAG: hypothetical protein WCJ70_05250, partial [bacterium]
RLLLKHLLVIVAMGSRIHRISGDDMPMEMIHCPSGGSTVIYSVVICIWLGVDPWMISSLATEPL